MPSPTENSERWAEGPSRAPLSNPDVETAVRLEGLTLGYGGRAVLTDVNLNWRHGEKLCLLGPNGSGKSTLLAALAGLLPPLKGAIRRQPGLTVGWVPQQAPERFELSVSTGEFVSLGLAGLHVAKAEVRARKAEVLTTTGLIGHERRPYAALSGGMRRRALIARALMRRPDLLLADEPDVGLDAATREALLEILLDARANVAFATHDRELAAVSGARVIDVSRYSVGTPVR